jgi:hypothetical protein
VRKALWLAYAGAYVAYSALAFFWIQQSVAPMSLQEALGGEAPYLLFLVAVIGLALQRRIIGLRFWKVVSAFAVIVFLHAWVVMPMIDLNSNSVSWRQVLIAQLFVAPALPMFVAVMLYAWWSPSIWCNAAQSRAPADGPPHADPTHE